jgi:hypothetical protein
MTRFLICLAAPPPGAAREIPASLVRFWPAVALGAILLPWAFYPAVGEAAYALQIGNLFGGLWPVAIGVGLALALGWIDRYLPRVPVGDSVVVEEAAFRRLLNFGPSLETLDARLRQWPAAGVSLLLIILALLTAGLSGRQWSDSDIRSHPRSHVCECQNQRTTSRLLMLVELWI